MSGKEMQFNPKMTDDGKPFEPYERDEERTGDPYRFDIDQNGVPLFTDKNIAFVNGMVENDSNYNQEDEEEIRSIFEGMFNDSDRDRRACIARAVYEVDRTNSTHLTAVGRDRVDKVMKGLDEKSLPVKAISAEDGEEKVITGGALLTARAIYDINDLKEQLSEGNDQLVTKIARAAMTRLSGAGITDVNKINFSFATKFCHWACLYLRLGDNYCIYDKVVASVLPYFVDGYADGGLDRWGCSRMKRGRGGSELVSTIEGFKKESDGYTKYRSMYDAVLEGVNKWRLKNEQNGEIGYHEVDRLLWYYFKGVSGKRIKQALASIDC